MLYNMNLNFQTEQDKIDFIRAYSPSADARAVINNPAQFQRYVADFKENFERNLNQTRDAIARIENAKLEEAKIPDRVDLPAIINENKAEIENWMSGLQPKMEKFGQWLDSSAIDQFNTFAEIANTTAGTNYPILEGGSGQKVTNIQNILTSASGTTNLQGETLNQFGGTGSLEGRIPGRPMRSDYPSGTEGTAQFTRDLTEYKAKEGLLNVDDSTEKAYFQHSDGSIVLANIGSPVVVDAKRLSPEEAQSLGFDASRTGTDTTGTDTTGATGSTGSTVTTGTTSNVFDTGLQEALDIINNSGLSDNLKALYRTVVQNWNPDTELNPGAIIEAFEEIKNTTIDPYYAGLANLAIEDVKSSRAYQDSERAIQLEAEGLNRAESIRGAKAGLEASGMTFSGEAQRQLGAESAYRQGEGEVTEGVIPFGGTPMEGLIPQQNRLIATSSESRYKQQAGQLARSAESTLGTSMAGDLGFATVGSVTGDLPESKEAKEAGTLSSLIGQQMQTKAQNENLDF